MTTKQNAERTPVTKELMESWDREEADAVKMSPDEFAAIAQPSAMALDLKRAAFHVMCKGWDNQAAAEKFQVYPSQVSKAVMSILMQRLSPRCGFRTRAEALQGWIDDRIRNAAGVKCRGGFLVYPVSSAHDLRTDLNAWSKERGVNLTWDRARFGHDMLEIGIGSMIVRGAAFYSGIELKTSDEMSEADDLLDCKVAPAP